MKIAQLVIGGEIAGGQLVAWELALAARERGDEVIIVAPGPGSFVDRVREDGFRTELLDLGRGFNIREALRLARLLRREQVDLLDTHTLLAGNVLGRLSGRLAGAAVVSHAHAVERFRPQPLLRAVYRALDNASARTCASVVAVSEAVRQELLAQGYLADKIALVRNGVRPPSRPESGVRTDVRTEFGIPVDAFLVGEIGRVSRDKGQQDLLAAAAHLEGAWVLLVGEDADGGTTRAALERTASELGLRERTVFTGFRDDVVRILQSLDVLALPSRTEGLPMILLEAMSHGVPVVATSVGGIPELVVDGVTGLLISAGDVAALTEALQSLLVDPNTGRELGEAGRARVADGFSLEDMTAATLALYDEAVSSNR